MAMSKANVAARLPAEVMSLAARMAEKPAVMSHARRARTGDDVVAVGDHHVALDGRLEKDEHQHQEAEG